MRDDIGFSHKLTPRELEVLRLIARGLTVPAIAVKFRISPRTVRNHMVSIRIKLQARTAAHAVSIAKNRELI